MCNLKKRVRDLLRTPEADSVEFYDGTLGIKKLIRKEGKGIDWYDIAFLLPLIFGISFFYFLKIGIVYTNDAFLMIVVVGTATVGLLSSTLFLYRRLLWRLISGETTIEELRNLKEEN